MICAFLCLLDDHLCGLVGVAKDTSGAALDVVEGEPNVPPELLALDNVLVTPHYAGRAPEARTAATALLLDNLNAHFAGRPLPTRVA